MDVRRLLMAFTLLLLAFSVTCTAAAQAVESGDEAPAFELPGSDGKTYSLKQFKGVEPVVIAWYPKAFTGG